ncbi:MAG: GTPase Era [Bacteroidota bacterium]
MEEEKVDHRAGFVNILGSPNVGKSTLMNALVGEKVSIITSKAQTTRHRIHGIVNGENFQIVYSDTPGLLNPKYKLQENMLRAAKSALIDADIIVFVTEVNESPSESLPFINRIKKAEVPVFLVMNKIDLSHDEQLKILHAQWKEILPECEFFPVSALMKFNLDNLFERILEDLPQNPPYFPKENLTDKSERFLTAEVIREKILLNYKQEVPYAVEVEVEEFKEKSNIIRIRSVIYVERDSQKGIIIGGGGKAVKKVGVDARKDLEKFFGKKIFLELFVKVKKDWRNSEKSLKDFGYH